MTEWLIRRHFERKPSLIVGQQKVGSFGADCCGLGHLRPSRVGVSFFYFLLTHISIKMSQLSLSDLLDSSFELNWICICIWHVVTLQNSKTAQRRFSSTGCDQQTHRTEHKIDLTPTTGVLTRSKKLSWYTCMYADAQTSGTQLTSDSAVRDDFHPCWHDGAAPQPFGVEKQTFLTVICT